MKSLKIFSMRQKFPYKKISITKCGMYYVLMLLIIGYAAFNSGNNLIYLIFAISLSLFGASSFLAKENLKDIECELETPEEIYAKKDTLIVLEMLNRSRRRKFFIGVEAFSKQAYIDTMTGKTRINFRVRFEKRGKIRANTIDISSSYPFGFFLREKQIKIEKEMYVFPEIRGVKVKTCLGEIGSKNKMNNEGEFYSLEDYQDFMDARRISWKVSARANMEMIVNLSTYEEEKIHIVFNNSKRLYSESEFEEAVVKVASLAYQLFRGKIPFRFSGSNFEVNCRDYEDYLHLMRYLSEVKLENIEDDTMPKGGITADLIEYA